MAIERSVYEIIGGAYRKCNITTLELRFNPMKRNREGEQDLDHIISAAIRGQDRALLEYPQVRAGLILMMDRTFPPELNAIVVEKALRYRDRGVVGIDIAGPPNHDVFVSRSMRGWWSGRGDAGLGVTIHTGEEGQHRGYVGGALSICARTASAMASSALTTTSDGARGARWRRAGGLPHLESAHAGGARHRGATPYPLDADERGVPFTINTDGPQMLLTNIVKEYQLLLDTGIFDDEDVRRCIETAQRASFLTAREPARVG